MVHFVSCVILSVLALEVEVRPNVRKDSVEPKAVEGTMTKAVEGTMTKAVEGTMTKTVVSATADEALLRKDFDDDTSVESAHEDAALLAHFEPAEVGFLEEGASGPGGSQRGRRGRREIRHDQGFSSDGGYASMHLSGVTRWPYYWACPGPDADCWPDDITGTKVGKVGKNPVCTNLECCMQDPTHFTGELAQLRTNEGNIQDNLIAHSWVKDRNFPQAFAHPTHPECGMCLRLEAKGWLNIGKVPDDFKDFYLNHVVQEAPSRLLGARKPGGIKIGGRDQYLKQVYKQFDANLELGRLARIQQPTEYSPMPGGGGFRTKAELDDDKDIAMAELNEASQSRSTDSDRRIAELTAKILELDAEIKVRAAYDDDIMAFMIHRMQDGPYAEPIRTEYRSGSYASAVKWVAFNSEHEEIEQHDEQYGMNSAENEDNKAAFNYYSKPRLMMTLTDDDGGTFEEVFEWVPDATACIQAYCGCRHKNVGTFQKHLVNLFDAIPHISKQKLPHPCCGQNCQTAQMHCETHDAHQQIAHQQCQSIAVKCVPKPMYQETKWAEEKQHMMALIANNPEKPNLMKWIKDHVHAVEGFAAYTTGTKSTGALVKETFDLDPGRLSQSGPLGGDVQAAAFQAAGWLGIAIFFWSEDQPHTLDIESFLHATYHWLGKTYFASNDGEATRVMGRALD